MFNGPGAKKYDFSNFNPLIVGAVILLICYLGSKNTYYDQFYHVSQLPENRNELSVIKSIVPEIAGNKVLFNISLQFTFKITFENFRQSFSIKIDHYGFRSIHYHNNLFDYQLNSNNYLSGFALSSVFGPVNVTYYYLDEKIAQLNTNIPGIHLLFPGNTIISKKSDHIHLSNVYISKKNEIKVYFQNPIEYDSNWVKFENGCYLPLTSSKRPASEECSTEGQCISYDRITHLFSVPQSTDLNSYNLFLSLFNPILDFTKGSQEKIVVWSNSQINDKAYQLILEMNQLLGSEIEIMNSEKPNFFKELRIRLRISNDFKKLTKNILRTSSISDNFENNKLVIVTDEDTKNMVTNEKAKDISSVICSSVNGGCNTDIVEFVNNADFVSKIHLAHFLILPKKKAHFMFSLKKSAKVFLLSDQQNSDDDSDNKWINEMAKNLSIEAIFVKYENGNLDSSVFNI